MAGLQRSSETFRRSGSSGMVWEEKHRSASGKDQAPGAGAGARPQRSGSGGHGGYRAGHVQPALDPPSPRVAACGFCNLFGKQEAPAAPQPRAGAGSSAKGKRR